MSFLSDYIRRDPGPEPSLGKALARASRKLGLADDRDTLLHEIPRAILEVVPADVALVVERAPDGSLAVVSRFGARFEDKWEWYASIVEDVLRDGRTRLLHEEEQRAREEPDRGRLMVVRLGGIRPSSALVIARTTSSSSLRVKEIPRAELFAVVAAMALRRVQVIASGQRATMAFRSLINSLQTGVVHLDSEGVVLGANEAGMRWLEMNLRKVVGKPLTEISGIEGILAAMDRAEARRSGPGAPVTTPAGQARMRVRSYSGGTLLLFDASNPASDKGLSARYTFDDLVAEDQYMLSILRDAKQAASSDVPILITGESGTGKEVLAQAVHNASPRSGEPFVAINVAAIPSDLLESELFGYAEGAFTGARVKGKAGKFELAGRGTILLDEIGEMSPLLQSKLLRVLQEQQVVPLGSDQVVPLHARVMATTNRDLLEEVREGRFRLDLYHRLRVVHIHLPALRERIFDIPWLVEHYLAEACGRVGRPNVRVTTKVMEQLRTYTWPGNVRELANLLLGVVSLLPQDVEVIDELPIFASQPELTPVAAPSRSGVPAVTRAYAPAEEVISLDEAQKRAVKVALKSFDGNMSKAAKALGISRTTLYAKIKQYGLET